VGCRPTKGNALVKSACKLAIVLLLTTTLGGCRAPQPKPVQEVRVVLEGTDAFPEALAGRWKADRDGWEFVVQPDGRLASAVVSLGRVTVTPGQTVTVPTRSGGEAVFEPGPWTVHYAAPGRLLTVRIAMDYVRVEMGESTLEGESADTFSGPVMLDDGIWQVQWTTFTDYTARTASGLSIPMGTDPTYGETKPLTFTKVPPD
jgi:hypothetical protein